jgi:hypothetical protein
MKFKNFKYTFNKELPADQSRFKLSKSTFSTLSKKHSRLRFSDLNREFRLRPDFPQKQWGQD